MGRIYVLHKTAGKTSFFLILAHPILLGAGRLMSGDSLSSIWDWWSVLTIVGVPENQIHIEAFSM